MPRHMCKCITAGVASQRSCIAFQVYDAGGGGAAGAVAHVVMHLNSCWLTVIAVFTAGAPRLQVCGVGGATSAAAASQWSHSE